MKELYGDIFDILSADLSSLEEEKLLVERISRMDSVIIKKSNYYIAHFPERSVENRWELVSSYEYSELFEKMAIKEGVNMYEIVNGFRFIAYYGSYSETLNLYPISDEKAKELQNIIDNAELDSSIVIDAEIAQYCY